MTAKQLEFFFDVGSPAAYLAWTQLPGIAAAAGAELVWRPMLLGAVFKATGNASPAMVPAKARYLNADLARFAARYRVPFRLNPHFPINTLPLMRALTGFQMQRPGQFGHFLGAVFEAMWSAGVDLGDPARLAATLGAAGYRVDEVLGLAEAPEVKERLKATTEEAVARGVFGAPSCFVDGVLYFGQDRLDFVREALG